MPIRTLEQLHAARRLVLEWATRLEFSALERTKLVTAASELGRNTLVHGKGGTMTIMPVSMVAGLVWLDTEAPLIDGSVDFTLRFPAVNA